MPSSEPRLRVLLCWGYHRRGWIAPFEQLDREFDFEYLFYVSKEDEESSCTNRPRHYWDDFRTAQEILDELDPDRVVFMSLAGLRSIALNMSARRRGIPTFIFQHGYFQSLESYLSMPVNGSKRVSGGRQAPQASSARRAIAFMLRSNLAKEPADSLLAIAMLVASRKMGAYRGQSRFRFGGRMPDRYITYSQATSSFHVELDGAAHSSIVPVGIPEFDPVFRLLAASGRPSGAGVLLIDSPNAENRYGVVTTTPENKARFLVDLSERLEARGCPLTVKLHPETYDATWLPSHPNLRYVRDGDVAELIRDARACLGFDSTLVIPAIITRPTLLFELRQTDLTARARELGAAMVVGCLECSDAQLDALLQSGERPADPVRKFTECFAHSADGQATKRLASALREPFH